MGSATSTTAPAARRHLTLAGVGCALLVVCAVLYASGVSRATGIWLLPLAAASTAVGATAASGRPVPRWVYWALAVAAIALAALGTWTLLYAVTHQPRLD